MTLKPGMIFTIEPMINAGKAAVKLLPDQWTVVTKDHQLTAQWEHTILVTDTGYEILTHRSDDDLPRVGLPGFCGACSHGCCEQDPPAHLKVCSG